MDPHTSTTSQQHGPLGEVAAVFLRLGATAFGGPAAHIAMMDDELVRRRKWISREEFLDLLGATNLIPGPNSTELAIHLGYHRAGWAGLIVAGSCFILPAMAIVLAIACLYATYGTLPQVGWLLHGVKPVILAIVAQALWGLGKTALKNIPTAVAAALVVGGSFLGFSELLLLALAGLGVMLWSNLRTGTAASVLPLWPLMGLGAVQAQGLVERSVTGLFLFFLKVGSVLYGSGYVLLAFLQADLVERWGWITSQQLLDAIAVGQFTPGPVFTTATFIGYLVGGLSGAVWATVGIFLPAFLFVGLLTPLLPLIRRSKWAAAALDGINAASLGLMAAVSVRLAGTALIDPLSILLALAGLGVLLRFKVNSAWLVLGGGIVGWVAHLI